MLLQALSLGCEIDVQRSQSGVVHSVFDRAVNLIVGGEMWSVLAASRADAPFGIRLATGNDGFDVHAADRVHVRAGFVKIGRLVLDCRTASRWAPTFWAKPAADLATRLSGLERTAGRRAWGEAADLANGVVRALHGSEAELAATVRRTVGRGPGLTPSGDDVLVGMFVIFTSGAAGKAGTHAASRLASALAPALHSTPDISRHLLHQVARGLPGRALHDLGKALIEGAPCDVFADALTLALDIGDTSGADACMGLAAACRFSFLNTERLAA